MTVIGVSLKMYFGHAQTLDWCRAVRQIAQDHDAVRSGRASLFVLPTFPSIPAAVEILAPLVTVGAQDIAAADDGPFTGEVSGRELAELGCTLAEIGHAERRRLFGETPTVVSDKVAAAYRAGLTPLLCVGEQDHGDTAQAITTCVEQVDSALAASDALGLGGSILVAYEPVWAIGQTEAAAPGHVREVSRALTSHLASRPFGRAAQVIYGGSAGPGLLTELHGDVDGLFLGRFAHDPAAVAAILDEVYKLTAA